MRTSVQQVRIVGLHREFAALDPVHRGAQTRLAVAQRLLELLGVPAERHERLLLRNATYPARDGDHDRPCRPSSACAEHAP